MNTSPPAIRPPIVLLGVPGTGASSVGRAVADALDWEFRDTERMAAAALGHEDVSRAFVAAGEEAFHAAEVAVALTELRRLGGAGSAPGEHPSVVLVLGSGVLAAEPVRRAAQALPAPGVIELTVSLAHAAPRLGLSLARPVFLGNPRAQWARLAQERRAGWADVVGVVVDTDDASIPEVAARVLAALDAGAPARPEGDTHA